MEASEEVEESEAPLAGRSAPAYPALAIGPRRGERERRRCGRPRSPPSAPGPSPSLSWPRAYPGSVKRILPVLAGAAVAAFGALIVGEYEFEGVIPVLAGLVLGVLVSEAVALGGQWRGRVPAAVAGALAAGGLVWAGWIDSGEGLEPYPALAWLGAAVAALTAGARARGPRARRRRSSPPPA